MKNFVSLSVHELTLVSQRWRIHPPMQEAWARPLAQEEPTCLGTVKPMCHKHWGRAPEPGGRNCGAHELWLLKPAGPTARALQQKSLQWEARKPQLECSPCSPQLEKHPSHNEDLAQPQTNDIWQHVVNRLLQPYLFIIYGSCISLLLREGC